MIEYENLKKLNSQFADQFKKVFNDFIDSGWYILGKGVEQFENEFARYNNVKHCIGVASGLDALILAIAVFNFKKGSEIIVPANTYIATIIAITRAGMTPVLVEPDIATYNIDPKRIKKAITTKTVAILPVHLYGKMSAMNEICNIARKCKLEIIEDCAQAHGAKYNDKLAGTYGVGAFSFYPTKNLGALGDGGAIITDDSNIAEKLRKLRNYGSNKKYHFEYVGYNSRLDELQAMFLSVKLQYLDEINCHKRKLAELYFSKLDSRYILPARNDKYYDTYHIYNIRHNDRDKLKQYLLENGIKTEIHYPIPPHSQYAYKDMFASNSYIISESIHRTTLSLPISYSHTPEDIKKVIDAVNCFLL